jgi:hypothetical protein
MNTGAQGFFPNKIEFTILDSFLFAIIMSFVLFFDKSSVFIKVKIMRCPLRTKSSH